MPGKDFEQQVRETLGPWRLDPSANVWGRLEEDLARRKKRRRAFYLFLLAGLLAGGALFRFGLDMQSGRHPMGEATSQSGAHQPSQGGMVRPDQEIAGVAQQQPVRDDAPTDQDRPDSSPGKTDAGPGIQDTLTNNSAMDQPAGPVARRTAPTAQDRSKMQAGAEPAMTGQTDAGQPGREHVSRLDTGRDDESALGTVESEPMQRDEKRTPEVLPDGPRDHGGYPSPFAGPVSLRAVPREPFFKTDSSAGQPQAAKLTDKYTRKNTIRFGLAAGLGRSAFTEGLGVSSAKSTNVNAGPTTGGGSGNPTPVYDYRQDPSLGWELGMWMQKSISRRWHFSAGLSYIQFSTRTPVGQYLGDTARLYNNGTRDQVTVTAYSGGSQSDYINRYHILQLPLSFAWQMNQGRKLPIILTMGLSPGYLLASNALVRDSAQVLYNHPDNQRSFQLGFRSGLHLRLMPASGHPLDIGPVVQYQLNQVFTDGNRDNGHLYYLGVEARIPIFSVTGKQR